MLSHTRISFSTQLDHDPNAFTILIVDEDMETVSFLVQTVLRPRGYKTQVARTGSEAASLVRRRRPDLIMTVWNLRDMMAEELMRTLTESGRRVPTIIIADSSEAVANQAFQLGARGYLTKPLNIEESIQAIRRVLTEGWTLKEQTHQIAAMRYQLQSFIAFSQMTRSIMQVEKRDELYIQSVDAAIMVTRAEESFLLLVNPHDQSLELRAMRGFGEETTKLVRFPTRETSAMQVIQSGQPLRLSQKDPSGHTVRTGYLVKGLIHVPIVTNQGIIGVLSVDRKVSTEAFTAEDEDMLVRLAACTAVALEKIHRFHQIDTSQRTLFEKLDLIHQAAGLLQDSLPELNSEQEIFLDQINRAVQQAKESLGANSD